MLRICSAPSFAISINNAFLFDNYTFVLTCIQKLITQIKKVSVIKTTIYNITYLFLQCILQHKHFSTQLPEEDQQPDKMDCTESTQFNLFTPRFSLFK